MNEHIPDLIFKRIVFNLKVFSTGKINDQNSAVLEIVGLEIAGLEIDANEILVNVHTTIQTVFVDPVCFSEG